MENETTVAVLATQDIEQSSREEALTQSVTDFELRAEALVIDTEESYRDAAEFGRMLKQQSAKVREFWKPLKDAAHKAHAEICDKEKAMLKPLTNAETALKKAMGAYVAEQERKRREAEEAARRAAKEEAERKMREAIALEENGNAAGAEAALDEAEIMDAAASEVSIATTKPKVSGVTTRRDWKITSVDPAKVPTTIAGVEIRPVDTAAVMRLIRATKGQVKIPGIVYEETATVAFRR